MKFTVRTGSATTQRTACAIVGVYADGTLDDSATALDRAAGGLIRAALKGRDIKGEVGETLMLMAGSPLPCRRILLVGLGKRQQFDRRAWRRAVRAACAALGRTRHADATCYLSLTDVPGTDAYRRARLIAEVWHEASYRFTTLKSERGDAAPPANTLAIAAGKADLARARRGIADGDVIGKAVNLARELGNLPANVCTPTHLVGTARRIGARHPRLKVRVLNRPQITRLKMGAFLAVTRGAAEPPRFIIMEWRGGKRGSAPIVLVGKGITFDSGGISLKPGPAMDEMKYDMCGAAGVIATLQAAAELGLPVNVVALVPACENLPSGTATRPGDIVRSMSGKTIEILNTDAEGRLILCDALSYALRYKPAALIDVATLTGACVVALGKHRSGLLASDDGLAGALLDAGEAADDRAWRLPLDAEYGEQLKSNFADMANIGGRDAGAITAASFLSRFVGNTPWAHLDIAGTAWLQGSQKGGTGRPVPLLVEYLLAHARS